MKKIVIWGILCLALMACSQIIEVEPVSYETKELVFTAFVADTDVNTKTARQADNVSVYWSPNDAISVFYINGENGGSKFVAQNTEEAEIAQFKGAIDVISGGGEGEMGEFWFWGVYPYSSESSCDGSSITTVIPSQQVGKAGTFADNTFITMARSKGLNLGFYNICCGIKFSLTRDDIQQVSIRGNKGEDIAGKVKVVWDENGKPAISQYIQGEKEVTVTAPVGGTFEAGQYYYLVLAPELFSEGFTLSLTTSDSKKGYFAYENSRQFNRGKFVVISDLDTMVSSWIDVATKSVPEEGGEVTLEVLSGGTCHAVIPDEAQSWISVAPETKSMTKQAITLIVQPNTGLARSATINVVGDDDASIIVLSYTVTQEAGGVWKEGIVPPNNEIWYISSNNNSVELNTKYGFGAVFVSNEYSSGKGVIRFSGDVTDIPSYMFIPDRGSQLITHIMIPESVRTIHSTAFYNCFSLKSFTIPSNVETLEAQCLMNCYSLRTIEIPSTVKNFGIGIFNCDTNLEKFDGDYPGISEDRRCLIVDKTLNSFAPFGLEEYSFPEGLESIGFGAVSSTLLHRIILPSSLKHIEGRAFDLCSYLQEINIPEGVLDIGQWALRANQLETIHIPSSVESIGNAAFGRCSKMKRFTGKFSSEDGLFLVVNGEIVSVAFAGLGKRITIPSGVTVIGNQTFETGTPIYSCEELELPDGLTTIGTQAFCDWYSLRHIRIPSSVVNFGLNPFQGCRSLEYFEGENSFISSDHRSLIINKTLVSIAPGGLTEFIVPDEVEEIGFSVFGDGSLLESVILPEGLKVIGERAFRYCNKITSITLPSTLTALHNEAFSGCRGLETVYCKAATPPAFIRCNNDRFPFEWNNPSLVIFVPEQMVSQYQNSWPACASFIRGYDFGIEYEYYLSSDYSTDGVVTALQSSSVGVGIDLILMGDAFSDRQIADGTYSNVMQKAMNAFFSEEPYKSMKNCFNVYTVNVVSATEGYEHAGQALSTGHGNGTYVYGNDSKVIEYAQKAISEDRIDDALVIVMMNEDAYAGTCFMYDSPSGDYGRGLSIAYFPTSSDTDTFNGLVSHEAGGHGFAKLADEYAYESMGAISASAITEAKAYEPYGWWKNIDFTSDQLQVKWSPFISDERYISESIGCYEGAFTYWSGVWRPTENSIMRYNTGGFNAPSRYAIWYRINKLAYGDSWTGTYEDFVTYDQINRTPAAVQRRRTRIQRQSLSKPLPPLAPPVVVGHNWREE